MVRAEFCCEVLFTLISLKFAAVSIWTVIPESVSIGEVEEKVVIEKGETIRVLVGFWQMVEIWRLILLFDWMISVAATFVKLME